MEEITTKRLVLRKICVEDALSMHELFSDEEAMRNVGMYPAFTEIEETKERIERWKENNQRLAIMVKETKNVVGYIAINPDSDENRQDTRELGFAIISKYRGNGYIKETINAVLEQLKKDSIKYVWACCFKGNIASECLIRKMGFKFQQFGT